ncbi:hypothetical protein ES703_44549 [subsurface metagenome]
MIEIYITRNLHILWMYIPDTTIYIKFIKRANSYRAYYLTIPVVNQKQDKGFDLQD